MMMGPVEILICLGALILPILVVVKVIQFIMKMF